MANADVSKLSFAELVELQKQQDWQIEGRRSEELKVLADGYIEKSQAAGFEIVEPIEALQPYGSGKRSKQSNPRVLRP